MAEKAEIENHMSQDNMIKFECTVCKKVNYYSRKNKKTLKERMTLRKYCPNCNEHTEHKETK